MSAHLTGPSGPARWPSRVGPGQVVPRLYYAVVLQRSGAAAGNVTCLAGDCQCRACAKVVLRILGVQEPQVHPPVAFLPQLLEQKDTGSPLSCGSGARPPGHPRGQRRVFLRYLPGEWAFLFHVRSGEVAFARSPASGRLHGSGRHADSWGPSLCLGRWVALVSFQGCFRSE